MLRHRRFCLPSRTSGIKSDAQSRRDVGRLRKTSSPGKSVSGKALICSRMAARYAATVSRGQAPVTVSNAELIDIEGMPSCAHSLAHPFVLSLSIVCMGEVLKQGEGAETVLVQESLVERVELIRLEASRHLDSARKVELGQFLTPVPVAAFMASMLESPTPTIHLLDAGAGIGSLSSAVVEILLRRAEPPKMIQLTAYELDDMLLPYLSDTMTACRKVCAQHGVNFQATIHQSDFVSSAVETLRPSLFGSSDVPTFTAAILTPPLLKDSLPFRDAEAVAASRNRDQ